MPSSQPWRLSTVCNFIYQLKPGSVLDMGIGFGKWGVLAREYTDVANGLCAKAAWKLRLEGIEIFPAYRNPLWEVYDKVHIGNAIEILPTLGKYDLILAIEILEHCKREDGLKLIAATRMHSKHFVISYSNSHSTAMYGNQHEAHVSKWTSADFAGCKLLCSIRGGSSEVYVGRGTA